MIETGTTESRVSNPSRESLLLAYRWCLYAWVSIGIGMAIARVPEIVARAIAAAFIIAGCLFAFVAIGLSLVGMIIPGRSEKRYYWGSLAIALPPLLFLGWKLFSFHQS